MSDYFGALMNLSGLGGGARGLVAPANAPDAGGDIEESEVEAVAAMPAAEPPGPARAAPPIIGRAGSERASPESGAEHVPLSAQAAADFSPAQGTAARTISTVPGAAAAVAAPIIAEPHHAIVRAVLEWVASDPYDIADRRDITEEHDIVAMSASADARMAGRSRPGAASSAREQPASPTIGEAEVAGIGKTPRMEVSHRLLAADVEAAPPHASARASAAPSSRIVTEPAVFGRVAPVADETVEISIGAIHVRVDAPVPQAPAAPAPAAHMPSAGSAAGSALSRRALRRF